MTHRTRTNILAAALALLCVTAAATDGSSSRRLLNGRRLNGPSDLLNALLQDVNRPLIKTLGHLKFKDYDKSGVKLTNLRTFDFDVDGGQLLKGTLSNDLKSVALSVSEFKVRLHSRWKRTHGIWRPGGQCDFQIKNVHAKVSGDIASLSPFRFSNVKVDVQPGTIVPSCDGLAGAIINVAVHLFDDLVMPQLHDIIDKDITQILEKGTGQSLLEQRLEQRLSSSSSSSTADEFIADVLSPLHLPSPPHAAETQCLPNGEYCSNSDPCCGTCSWGTCGDSTDEKEVQDDDRAARLESITDVLSSSALPETQCIEDFQKCGHGHQNCCNNGLCLYQSGCNGGFGGTCCDNKRRFAA